MPHQELGHSLAQIWSHDKGTNLVFHIRGSPLIEITSFNQNLDVIENIVHRKTHGLGQSGHCHTDHGMLPKR